MTTDFPYDVFLSHNQADKPRVLRLAERLRAAGLRVWFDEWNVRSGDVIALKVDEGLEQSRVLLLCISPNALDSGWVALERSTAVHRDPANVDRRFIPLLLADCKLPDTLRRYKYVDFRLEADSAFEELLTACRENNQQTPTSETTAAAAPNNPQAGPTQPCQFDHSTAGSIPVGNKREMAPKPVVRPIGDAWSGLRGLLEQGYSFKSIMGILGKAGLPISKMGYAGTHTGPFLNEVDGMVESLDDPARDKFVVGCIQEIREFERIRAANLSRNGSESDGRTEQNLRIVLARYGHDLNDF